MDKLSISILDAEPNKSVNDLANEVIEFNKKQMTGYQVIESTPTNSNGHNAHKIVYTDNSYGIMHCKLYKEQALIELIL